MFLNATAPPITITPSNIPVYIGIDNAGILLCKNLPRSSVPPDETRYLQKIPIDIP